MRSGRADVVTAMRPAAPEEPAKPERVKVACNTEGRALYFSREAIPHAGPHHIHIGVYGFAPGALGRCAALPKGDWKPPNGSNNSAGSKPDCTSMHVHVD